MVNANQVRLKWPCIQSAQEKAKENGGKKEKKEEKMGIKMKKKNKQKEPSPCAYIFPL